MNMILYFIILYSTVVDEDFVSSNYQLIFGPCDPCGEGTETIGETTNEFIVYVKDDDNLEDDSVLGVIISSASPDNVIISSDFPDLILVDDGKSYITNMLTNMCIIHTCVLLVGPL